MKKVVLLLLIVVTGLGLLAYLNPAVLSWLGQTTGTMQKTTKVYKWRDKDGAWHITNEPPPSGTKYQEQEYLHDTNVLPTPNQDGK